MEQELQRLKAEALEAIKGAADQQALQDIRVKYLGKKCCNKRLIFIVPTPKKNSFILLIYACFSLV